MTSAILTSRCIGHDPFPKVTVTRQMVKDGSRYFGPYTSVWAVHQTLDVLRRIFPYLTCDRRSPARMRAPACITTSSCAPVPASGRSTRTSYRQMIDDLCKFLEGHTEPIVKRLRSDMEKAAEELHFEQAAAMRDQIKAIEQVVEKQKVISSRPDGFGCDRHGARQMAKPACRSSSSAAAS